eukprot:CAMPEP_0197078660 /NCGR_PEP_ID=MMETSP1384-20130603/213232_1 /TAXON_ID=29189 /ORGANISM="Ammonia sp." /LENGTH=515 /DNA_ID=CAMNT_0042517527 /DNA_START=94 /DNA_END=1639 /DNA_ORIENTATION=-
MAETSDCEQQGEAAPAASAGLIGLNVSHKVVLDMADDDDNESAFDYPNQTGHHQEPSVPPSSVEPEHIAAAAQVSRDDDNSLLQRTPSRADEYEAGNNHNGHNGSTLTEASLLGYDNFEVEDFIRSKKTTLIEHEDLTMLQMIGKGHFGEVYVGKYAGNKVAIKTFADLDIHNLEPEVDELPEKEPSPFVAAFSGSLEKLKSIKKGGYHAVAKQDDDDEDDEDVEGSGEEEMEIKTDIHSDSETMMNAAKKMEPKMKSKKNKQKNGVVSQNTLLQKKIYARKKEIYSEVALACSLPDHPNLVRILGITRNPLKIVMAYYEGGNLKDFVYRDRRQKMYRGKIQLLSIVVLLRKIADGLLFLHNQKLVHRDIAARNVLLGLIESDGQIREKTEVVVADFGMTRLMSDNLYKEKETKQKIGPVKWMAPESISKQKYSYKSDVYMFGITVWEIMHGKQPYSDPKYSNYTLPILATKIVKLKHFRPVIDETHEFDGVLLGDSHLERKVITDINRLMQDCW